MILLANIFSYHFPVSNKSRKAGADKLKKSTKK
jgi:hypothetical protein